MSSNYPFVTDPSVDSSQFTDQSTPPDTGMPFADFSSGTEGVPLSGDTYVPTQTQVDTGAGTNTPLPFVPTGGQQQDPLIGKNVRDIQGYQGFNPSYVGRNIKDIHAELMPHPAPASPVGHQQPKYGNDIAGQVLTAEQGLPGGEGAQAFVHGAQSQIVPGASALLAGAGAGALAGSVVPGVGTVVGGIVGGLIGYWVGSQAQDALTKQLVDKQTQDAYQLQSQYEQANDPIQYGLGELAPQLVAFKPNPKAIMSAFRLAGAVKSAPLAEKLAVIKGPAMGESLAERLAYQEHQDALNQMIMMAYGTGYTAYQAQQQIAAGNVQPALLAVNLIGSTLLSKPRWIKDVEPKLQPGVDEAHQQAVNNYADGMSSPELSQAFQNLNDANQSGDQTRIAQAQAEVDRIQQAVEQPAQPTTEAQPVRQPEAVPQTDPIAQELIDNVNSAATREEKFRAAAEADNIAAQRGIPNWESQVARVQGEEQSQLKAQTQTIKGLAENPAFPRQPAVSPQDHLNALQEALNGRPSEELKTGPPDELRASIAANQAKTEAMQKDATNWQRKQNPGEYLSGTEEEQLARSANLPQHTQDVMQRLRQGEPAMSEDRAKPETIKLYHGTTNKALEDIQKYGLRPNNYHRVVNDIEVALGLNKDSLWTRPHMSNYREEESSIFLAGHPERAAAYAKRFGEAIDEALTAAYQMSHSQHRYVGPGDATMMKWKAQVADQLGIKPIVAEFEVPLKNIADQHYHGNLDVARQDAPNEVNVRHLGGLPPEALTRSTSAKDVSQLMGNRMPDEMMQGQTSPADYQQNSINSKLPQTQKYVQAAKKVNLAPSARFEPEWNAESRNFPQTGPPNETTVSTDKRYPMGMNPKDRIPYGVREIALYDNEGKLAATFSIAEGSKNKAVNGAFKIAVRPDLQRQGYGMTLLRQVEDKYGIDLSSIAGKNNYTYQGRNLLQKYFNSRAAEEGSSINAPEIKNFLSEARSEKGIGAGLDPSLIPTLGKNMYSGDIGMVAVKEGLQNALDSLRGVDQAKTIHVHISDDGLTMSDSGKGMLPAVMQKELVDIGGSTKEAGESGGWGLAKVALFSNASRILVHSVAVGKNGNKVISTLQGSGGDWASGRMRFSSTELEKVPEGAISTPTGTTMTLEWNPGVHARTYNAHDFLQRALTFNNLPDVRISVDSPHGQFNSDQTGLVSDRYNKLSTVSGIGAKMDVYASPSYSDNRYGSYNAEILNNGVYQFTLPIDVQKGIDLPSHLVIDVHATGSPKEDNYPWETNRQSLRPQLQEQVKQYVQRALVADAAKKMQAEIRDALLKAPKFEGSNFRVVDLNGNLEPHVVQAIAASKPLLGFVKQASREFGAFKGGTDKGPEFFGISLSAKHLGVNILASAGGPTRTRNYVLINPFVAFDEVSRGVEIPTLSAKNLSSYRGFNLELYNPRTHMFEFDDSRANMRVPDLNVPQVEQEWLQYVLRNEIAGNGVYDWNPYTDKFEAGGAAEWEMPNVIAYIKAAHGYDATPNQIRGAANEAFGFGKSASAQQIDMENADSSIWADLAKRFAARMSATLIHEYAHEESRGHEEDFSSALTRNVARYLDDIYSYAKRITRYLTDNNYEGIKEIERLNREHDLSRRMGENEIFRNVSTGSTAEPERAIDQGSLGNGPEAGQRPIQPLHPSGIREAGQLAPGTGLGTGRPEQQIGERNGIQQEAAGDSQEAGQNNIATQGIQTGQASNPGEIGSEASDQNISGQAPIEVNPAQTINQPGSSTGGNGNAEAGSVPTSTIGAGTIRPNAGNESGPSTGAEPNAATSTNANATTSDVTTAGNAEANAAVTAAGNGSSFERGTGNAEQSGSAGTGSGSRSTNATAANPTVVKATADTIRTRLKTPGYISTPEEKGLLSVLDNKVKDMSRAANPQPWPVADTRLPNAVDKNLLTRTFKAVSQTPPIEGEGGRAYASRVVKATGIYSTLDHALAVAKAARDGFADVVATPDGKVGFRIEGKIYKDTPNFHVVNWDKDFHGVVHSILDDVPNETLAAEPYDQSPVPLDIQQLRTSFTDQFQPHTSRPPVLSEDKTIPSMQPHDFLQSSHAVDTPSNELSSESGANKIKAGLTQVDENLKAVEELQNRGMFDPEPVKKEFEKLSQAAGGGSGVPPIPPSGGGGNGEEPPSPFKGMSPQDRKQALADAKLAKTQMLEKNYVDAFKAGRLVDDPLQKRIHGDINDILSSVFRTFDMNLWHMSPRQWPVQASRDAQAFAMRFKYLNQDITNRIKALDAVSPEAEKRIRAVFTADDTSRPSLLQQMSSDEGALANHIHTYWQLLGDTLTRAGVIKSALEDYFPLIADKNNFAMGETYDKGNVVFHNGKQYVAKTDITKAKGTPAFDTNNWAAKPNSPRLAGKTTHAIARLRDTDGSLLFKTPEELQQWADQQGLGWKIKTNIGDVFEAQGASVIKSLVMKHAVDQLMNNEFEINKYGETAPAILTRKKMDEHLVALDNSADYVSADKIVGPWGSSLVRSKWMGNQQVPDKLLVWKPLAEQMEREATFAELGDNPIIKVSRFLSTINNYFKVLKFALTPMHAYSMLGNVSAHTGWSGTYGVVRRGAEITNNPAFRNRFFQLMRAGGSTEPIGEALSGPHSVLNNIPGIGNIFKLQEHLMWKTVGYNSLYGLGDKLSQEYLTNWAVKNRDVPVTSKEQMEADKFGMDAAKKAIGYLDQLDMSKNYNLGSNVLLLASRWTTGQLRTMGEAFGIKPLAKIGNPVPLEGSSQRSTDFMQRRQIDMSRRLIMGGMLRLFMVGTALSTSLSALFNNGVPSTPWDNYQKDPTHTFDIYMGRDPVTNRDQWLHMPFYLFQREMLDWGMSAVKAQQQGKDFVDINNLGDSVLAAPFVRFANKMNPVTKTGLEVSTGQELGQWMKGYSKSGIDSDQYIMNLNKSLQSMGIPDGGSLENRLLYAMRNLVPGINYPTDLTKETSDPFAVASAIAGLPFGSNQANFDLGFLGSRIDQGNAYTMGPNGQMIPTWQSALAADQKAQVGQQILQIASTMGTGTPEEEQQKLQQMEGLRQQGGFTPGQVVQLLLYGAGHNTGGKGLLYQALPPKTPEQATAGTPVILNGHTLTPQEESQYNSVKFQQEAFAIGQLMGDPSWKIMDLSTRAAAVNSAKSFIDRIVNEQFSIGLGTKKGNVVTTAQASSMLVSYNRIQKLAQAMVSNTPGFSTATPADQKAMLQDRITSAQTAVWDKYFGVGILKNANDGQMLQYVDVHSSVRDEVRSLVEQLPSYKTGGPAQQALMLNSGLSFADNLVNQSAQGSTPKTFDSPLNRQQLQLAVRNGVVLQDAALRELHNSFIYQEASATDQGLMDQKYTNLAHNIALYDMRNGVNSLPGSTQGFDASLRTTLAADEGYHTLVEQYFGVGGMAALKAKEQQLTDLKTRFRQEYAIAPAELSRYDTMINRWYEQQNPDYASFLHARTFWEKYDPVGQAYQASLQSNLGFEALDPLALS